MNIELAQLEVKLIISSLRHNAQRDDQNRRKSGHRGERKKLEYLADRLEQTLLNE